MGIFLFIFSYFFHPLSISRWFFRVICLLSTSTVVGLSCWGDFWVFEIIILQKVFLFLRGQLFPPSLSVHILDESFKHLLEHGNELHIFNLLHSFEVIARRLYPNKSHSLDWSCPTGFWNDEFKSTDEAWGHYRNTKYL